MTGKVSIVGAGCGGPELLTMKAWQLLQNADIVFYDTLTSTAIRDCIPKTTQLVDVGKRPYGGGKTHFPQEEIHKLIIFHAEQGKQVVRLKGGDSSVFGRLGEELDALREAQVCVEVIPGISSALAAPLALGIPLTHRQLSAGFMVVTGHEDLQKQSNKIDWELVAKNIQSGLTIVLLMAVKNIAKITQQLLLAGVSEDLPVAIIQVAWMPQERKYYLTLKKVPEAVIIENITSPAVFVLGDVVSIANSNEKGARNEQIFV